MTLYVAPFHPLLLCHSTPLMLLLIMPEAHAQISVRLDSLCLCRMSDLSFFRQSPQAYFIREN